MAWSSIHPFSWNLSIWSFYCSNWQVRNSGHSIASLTKLYHTKIFFFSKIKLILEVVTSLISVLGLPKTITYRMQVRIEENQNQPLTRTLQSLLSTEKCDILQWCDYLLRSPPSILHDKQHECIACTKDGTSVRVQFWARPTHKNGCCRGIRSIRGSRGIDS